MVGKRAVALLCVVILIIAICAGCGSGKFGIAAKNDNEMGYYQCYARAYERAKMIIEALYAQLPNVV